MDKHMTAAPAPTANERTYPATTVFASLACADRRRLLGAAHERAPDSLTRRDLATLLAPVSVEKPRDPEANEAVRRAFLAVDHTHLPKLEEAGLLERYSGRGTVAATDHAAFRDEGVVDAITGGARTDDRSLDALFRALADDRRRAVLDVLSHQFGPVHAETLAREVAARERDSAESDVPGEAVERILVDLVHVRLPRLEDAGFIDYDAAAGTVAYDGHPDLRVPWMHSVLGPDFRASLTGESSVGELGTIEGREGVVSFGQSLCDRADEELFCMFTATGLLEAGCFTRIRDAARRGADVYLGTRDPTVREYIEENAPDVVLWEPETDWLDLPVEGNRVGRLLVADREAAMLGTIGEEREDGTHEERSIVGEGADNTLVVMLRQMLRPRLDRLGGRSEDVDPALPL